MAGPLTSLLDLAIVLDVADELIAFLVLDDPLL